MRSGLPPLNSLRYFVVAAKYLNFSRAAQDLFITPAAVSHQIRALEEDLGVALFRRLPREIALTESGVKLLSVTKSAFEDIGKVVNSLRTSSKLGTLRVTVLPYFSSKWLAPRLERFWQACPGIELRLHHTLTPVDFAAEDTDIAIQWGHNNWVGRAAEFLFGSDKGPVCAPTLLNGPSPIRKPADILRHTALLFNDESYDDWALWFKGCGIDDISGLKTLLFDDVYVLMQAAAEGRGVLLPPYIVISKMIEDGSLVKLFPEHNLKGHGYYLVYPIDGLSRAVCKAFRDWLMKEIAAEKAETGQAPKFDGKGPAQIENNSLPSHRARFVRQVV